MALVNIDHPPGGWRNGTILQAKGRFYDMNLVRWLEKLLRPIGGWTRHAPAAAAMAGKCRAILPWIDNTRNRWIAFGTSSKLYVQREDLTLFDITPSGFTPGGDDATAAGGFGAGLFGSGDFGVPRTDTAGLQEASTSSLENFGQNLLACSFPDGNIYEWALNTASPAAIVTNAPTGCYGIVATSERFLMAFKGRTAIWSDQEDDTTWTPATTNQAGDFDLPTAGYIRKGIPLRGLTLLLTSVDVHTATYTDPTLVYGFARVGVGCGLCAKGAAVATSDDQAIWMSTNGFWLFNGTVQKIDCEVYRYVFDNINLSQISKVVAVHQGDFSEVWFFYPSSGSNENDSYVFYNYQDQIWGFGLLSRLCGADRGVFTQPLMVDANGYCFEHETGFNYDGAQPYAETGPIWLPSAYDQGQGDHLMEIQNIVPDELTQGDVNMTIFGRIFPNDADVNQGVFSMSSPTKALFQAALMRVRYTGVNLAAWAVGAFRIEMIQGDPLL